jgi:hypothetical protein
MQLSERSGRSVVKPIASVGGRVLALAAPRPVPDRSLAWRGHPRPTYPRPTYARPTYARPTYRRPSYARPTYARPTYARPSYARPTYARPTYRRSHLPHRVVFAPLLRISFPRRAAAAVQRVCLLPSAPQAMRIRRRRRRRGGAAGRRAPRLPGGVRRVARQPGRVCEREPSLEPAALRCAATLRGLARRLY